VLHLSNRNAPGLLLKTLVIPKRVQVGELRHKSVVFTHENGVRDSQVKTKGVRSTAHHLRQKWLMCNFEKHRLWCVDFPHLL
jgi:hypothetical protein